MSQAPVGAYDSVLSDDQSHITFTVNKFFTNYKIDFVKLARLMKYEYQNMVRMDEFGFCFSKQFGSKMIHYEMDFYTDDSSVGLNLKTSIEADQSVESVKEVIEIFRQEMDFFNKAVESAQFS